MNKIIFTLILLLQAVQSQAADIGIPCDEGASNTIINVGDIIQCSIESVGDSDVYTFSGTAGDITSLTLSDVGNLSASMVAEIYHNSMLITTLSVTNSGVSEDIILADSNDYTVLVNEIGNNSTDNYHIALQRRAPLPPEALSVCVDCVIETETINPVADSDVLFFNGSVGDVVALTLSDVGNLSASMIAEVFDPGQLSISSLSVTNSGTVMQLTLTEAGTYTVQLRENGDNSTDTYNFALQQLFPMPSTAVPLLFDTPTGNQEISPTADSDIYTFTGTSGDTVILTLSDVGNLSASMVAEVFDPNQLPIATLSVTNSGISETLALADSGNYTIWVHENGNNSTDTYTLNLQCLSGGCFTSPDASVSPVAFNFGDVNVGTPSALKTFTLSNLGDADLIVSTISSVRAAFKIINDACTGATISPSGNCTFDVVFIPFNQGRLVSKLTIQSNDPDTPALDVIVVGTGIGGGTPGVIGGSVFGVDVTTVRCINNTTGETIIINDGTADWDCGEAGLDTTVGDLIIINVIGAAN